MLTALLDSLGNDIVDLNSEDTLTHPGFDKRVFTDNELKFIGKSKEYKWLFWTAKESAYKALKRLLPELEFTPNKFEFNFHQREIVYNKYKFICEWEITNDYVYSFCYTGQGQKINNWIQSYNLTTNLDSFDPSMAVRDLAKDKISELKEINIDDIQIVEHKLESQIISQQKTAYYPEIWINNKKSDLQISFTHHGRFVALALGTPTSVG